MKTVVQTLFIASTLIAVQRTIHCETAIPAAATVRSTVTETGSSGAKAESLNNNSGKDIGEPLKSESSNRNTQTYNSLYSARLQQPLTQDSGSLQDNQDYKSAPRGQTLLAPITVYRPIDITNTAYEEQSPPRYASEEQSQQQQEQLQYAPQPQQDQYAPQNYAQQLSAQEVSQLGAVDSSYAQSPPQPTGYSSTYSSPEVKVVSHTRTIMPIVYSGNQRIKPSTDEEVAGYTIGTANAPAEQQQTQPLLQHELTYTQEAPGLSYAKSQPAYQSPLSSQNPDPRYPSNYGVAFQTASQLPASYNEQKYSVAPEAKQYAPLQPIQAHVQVIEDDAPKAYGERTQKLSVDHGQEPPKLYYPPSPSLSSLLAPIDQSYATQDANSAYRQPQLQQNAAYIVQQQPQQQQYATKDLANSYSVVDDSDPDTANKANVAQNYEYTIGDVSNYAVPQAPLVPQVYTTPDQLVKTAAQSPVDNSNYPSAAIVNSDSDSSSYGDDRYKIVNNVNAAKPSYNQQAVRPVIAVQKQPPRLFKLGPDIEYGFIPLTIANIKDLGGYGAQGYDGRGKKNSYADALRGQSDSGYDKQRDHNLKNSLLNFPNDDDERDDGIGKLLANVAHKTSNYKGAGDQPYSAKHYKPGGYGRGNYQKKAFEKPRNYGRDYIKSAQLDKDLYNSDDYVGSPKQPYRKRVRGYTRGGVAGSSESDLPPGASYNPRDVGLDESVIAQLNLDDNPYGRYAAASSYDLLSNADTGLYPMYGPKLKKVPYSASGQGFRSQYGYAAASEVSPLHAPSPAGNNSNNSNSNNAVMSLLGNLKGLRSLVSYLTGGING